MFICMTFSNINVFNYGTYQTVACLSSLTSRKRVLVDDHVISKYHLSFSYSIPYYTLIQRLHWHNCHCYYIHYAMFTFSE